MNVPTVHWCLAYDAYCLIVFKLAPAGKEIVDWISRKTL